MFTHLQIGIADFHRQVCRQLLPTRILKRKKRGFAVNVVDSWFRSSLSRAMAKLILEPSSRELVRTLLDEHWSKGQDNHHPLFSLVLFEQWLRSVENGQLGTTVH